MLISLILFIFGVPLALFLQKERDKKNVRNQRLVEIQNRLRDKQQENTDTGESTTDDETTIR